MSALMATSNTSSSPPARRSQDLVIPDDFVERERHVLLGFVLDDLGDLAGFDRRQLHELGEDMKSGGADVDSSWP